MFTRKSKITSALLCLSAVPMYAGCASGGRSNDTSAEWPCNARTTATTCAGTTAHTTSYTSAQTAAPTIQPTTLSEWPPNAVAGECYAKAYIPAKFETKSERVCVREASESLEIVPARYDSVEERVLVKEASTELVVVPAEYRTQEKSICVHSGQAGWVMDMGNGRCRTENGEPARNVFCLVATPPSTKTVTTQCLAKAATVREVAVAAQYETRQVQKCVAAATTKRIAIEAEYQNVDRTVAIAPGHMEWQRVICDADTTPTTMNAVKGALIAAGYKTGPMNGELNPEDWAAIKEFQVKNGLGIGGLSYETMTKLQVSAR